LPARSVKSRKAEVIEIVQDENIQADIIAGDDEAKVEDIEDVDEITATPIREA
jgi:hypothetical protein